MEIGISIIWLVFAVLFFTLGLYHWNVATTNVPPFKLSERPGKDMGSVKILGADIDQPVKDFTDDFNKHLTNQLACSFNSLSIFISWFEKLASEGELKSQVHFSMSCA